MPVTRIPIATTIDPESSSSSLVRGAEALNTVYDKYLSGTTFATQRAGIVITNQPEDSGYPSIGRGAHFWTKAESLYVVNYDKVTQGYGVVVGDLTAGRDPISFIEMNNYLVILDPENNEGWYIDISAPTTLVSISDLDFPPNQLPARQLAGGGTSLDNFLFVLDTEGTVWNSAFGDPSSWDALDFISAERDADKGVYLASHHDQIVVLGEKTIEFFYNAGEPTGSPLRRRQDVTYRTGGFDRKSVAVSGDKFTFVGSEQGGTLGLYEIQGFKLKMSSNRSIDEALSNLGIRRDNDFILSMSLVNDHYLTFLTPILPTEDDMGRPIWSSEETFVFDSSSNLWSTYDTDIKELGGFPVVDITDKVRGTDRALVIMFMTGDIAEFSSILEPIDAISIGSYFESDDYIENQNDYIFSVTADESSEIEISFSLSETDLGSITYKFGHSLWLVGTVLSGALRTEPINIRWSDDHYNTFTPYRQVSVDMNRKITQLGKFRRRAHEIQYKGPDTLRLEALELNIGVSKYA